MRYFVTGGAGFIGSHLVKELLIRGEVTVYDNLSLGRTKYVEEFTSNNRFRFIEGDLLNSEKTFQEMKNHDVVFHLAANSDISKGIMQPETDLEQGTIATFNVLEAMRKNNIKKIVFSSSSAVYGEHEKKVISENSGPLLPTSLYGASKLACEGLIAAYCHSYDFQAWILRFANIIGSHATHGVVYDFINKLKKNPNKLIILGNGKQSKPYVEVHDCVAGILFVYENSNAKINYYNLCCTGGTSVNEIAKIIMNEMELKETKLEYKGGKRGWKGDIPHVRLSPSKINKLGWKAKFSSNDAVRQGVKEILLEYCS